MTDNISQVSGAVLKKHWLGFLAEAALLFFLAWLPLGFFSLTVFGAQIVLPTKMVGVMLLLYLLWLMVLWMFLYLAWLDHCLSYWLVTEDKLYIYTGLWWQRETVKQYDLNDVLLFDDTRTVTLTQNLKFTKVYVVFRDGLTLSSFWTADSEAIKPNVPSVSEVSEDKTQDPSNSVEGSSVS